MPVTEDGFRDVRSSALCLLQYHTIASRRLVLKTSLARSRPSLSHASEFPFFPIPRLAAHHVRSAVSPPSTSGYALCASFARKPTSHSSRAQLFRRLQSELLWSSQPSFKVLSSLLYGKFPPLTIYRRPGQLSSQRLWTLEQTRSYADTIVKVPEMAESITEGTLKQWSKRAFILFN